MKLCALQLFPVAFVALLFAGAGAVPEALATILVPIVVGWLWAARQCAVARREREDLVSGIVRPRDWKQPVAFVFLFPIGVAASSAIALAITNYVGAGFSDMAGLVPMLIGIGAFAFAIVFVVLQEWALNTARRRHP